LRPRLESDPRECIWKGIENVTPQTAHKIKEISKQQSSKNGAYSQRGRNRSRAKEKRALRGKISENATQCIT
jgi:hypothetical protein